MLTMTWFVKPIRQLGKTISSEIKADDKHFRLNDPKGYSLDKMKCFVRRLGIAQKITYGYALAIGVAVLGTGIGLGIGDTYQKQAREQLVLANQEQMLLSELEKAVLEVRSHPQRLTTVFGDSIWFEYEVDKFSHDLNRTQVLINELRAFAEHDPNDFAINTLAFQNLLQGYETTTEAYTQLIHTLWQEIDPPNVPPAQIQAAQQQVLAVMNEKNAIQLNIEYEQLAEELAQSLATAQIQQTQANQALGHAEALRLWIVVISMIMSTLMALMLARYTSRAIAHPLEAVTHIAQRVTQESNFNLRATAATKDEVSSLANSLNQLIEWIGKYTHELELARDTLEQRVEERTEALSQALQNLQFAQTKLVQSEKMSSLGQLVAGVAHEINNPVNFISGNLTYATHYTQTLLSLIQQYQQQYPDASPELQAEIKAADLPFLLADLPKLLTSMQVGTNRIREIVKSLKNFSRLDQAEMKAVDIHEGIDSTLMILGNRLKGSTHHLEIQVIKKCGDLPKVQCYPGQLNQVFMNILANAIDALEERDEQRSPEAITAAPSKIIISSQVVQSRSTLEQTDAGEKSLSRGKVVIRIADNGPGMTEEVKQRVFDPFFTTKEVGRGTGLGMSISHQIIVEKHQGELHCTSVLGEGTEFVIEIPVQPTSSCLDVELSLSKMK